MVETQLHKNQEAMIAQSRTYEKCLEQVSSIERMLASTADQLKDINNV